MKHSHATRLTWYKPKPFPLHFLEPPSTRGSGSSRDVPRSPAERGPEVRPFGCRSLGVNWLSNRSEQHQTAIIYDYYAFCLLSYGISNYSSWCRCFGILQHRTAILVDAYSSLNHRWGAFFVVKVTGFSTWAYVISLSCLGDVEASLGSLGWLYINKIWGGPGMDVPHSWMVYHGQFQLQTDDDWGYPYDLGNLHMTRWCLKVAFTYLFLLLQSGVPSQGWTQAGSIGSSQLLL